jgi:galactose mutarotase-like enzyme
MNQEIIINKDGATATISLDGGNLLSWQTLEPGTQLLADILYQGSSARRGGIPILFPFANPLEKNIFKESGGEIGQHGFGRDSVWRLRHVQESVVILELSHNDISQQMQKCYPFEFLAMIRIELLNPTLLSYTLTVENTNKDTALPIAPGLHPYFPLQHVKKPELKLRDTIQKYDLKHIDWESEMEGNFYNWKGNQATMDLPEMMITIEEKGEHKWYENLVVWSQSETNRDHDFVCVEPFTRTTNAINADPIVVQPGCTWSTTIEFGVKFKNIPPLI